MCCSTHPSLLNQAINPVSKARFCADIVSLPLSEPLGTLPEPVLPAAGRSIRIVTYNILADQHASTEFAQDVLFKHCPRRWLDIHYRKQLVCKQLLNSAADLMCLQEVDAKVFECYLAPLLQTAGYSGVFDNKAGQGTEGSAIFYRDSLFECIGRCGASQTGINSSINSRTARPRSLAGLRCPSGTAASETGCCPLLFATALAVIRI